MGYIKSIIGLVLILISIAGFTLWELEGRERMTTDAVLVASETIPQGTVLQEEHIDIRSVPAKNRIADGLAKENLPDILGQTASRKILKNGQISSLYFEEEDLTLPGGQSLFVIPADWIFMRSSTLRRGDRITIYAPDVDEPIGTYDVAFVKDVNEIEVTNSDLRISSPVIDRINATGVIDHIEIICSPTAYHAIRSHRTEDPDAGLLIVQKAEVSL